MKYTKESLQNTWGVVESKEHAEFIIELAELHGFKLWTPSDGLARITHFIVVDGELMMHAHDCQRIIECYKLKQITIPLPPKESIKNAGDNLILGCEDSKCDEWIPQVGDKVLIDVSGYDVIYGKNIDGLTAVVRSIFKDGEATVYAVSRGGACYCFTGGILKKPKTPEEELRDDIIELTLGHMENKSHPIEANAYYLFSDLMDKYNIHKKPR